MASRHLLSTMQLYVDAVVQQSSDRVHDRLRSIDGYWAVRRHSSGCYPSFALMELELDIPEEIYRHPLLDRMRDCALYLICAGNVSHLPPPAPVLRRGMASDREGLKDLYSYPIERARGHALHNLVTTAMHQLDLTPQGAADWIGEWTDGIVREFLRCRDDLPSWDPETDRQVQEYVNGLAYWVRGNDDWSFESQRYFGVDGERVRKEKEIWMLPRVEVQEARRTALGEGVGDVEGRGVAGMQISTEREGKGCGEAWGVEGVVV